MAPYETAKVTAPSEADPSARSLIPRDGHADSYRAESQRRARSRGDAVKMPTRRGRGPGRWTQRHLCVLSSHPAPWASPGIQEGSQRRMVGGSYRKRCWLRGSAHLPTKASTKERKGPDAIPLEHVGQVSTTAKGPDEREVGETPSTTSEKSRRRRQTRHLCDQGSHPSTGWNLKAGGDPRGPRGAWPASKRCWRRGDCIPSHEGMGGPRRRNLIRTRRAGEYGRKRPM